jgi:hypothetical protein
MASVRVRFSPGFPLRGGFPAEQFAGGKRLQEERLLRWTAQQNEAPPAEFYCSLEEGAPAAFGFRREENFPEANCLVFAPAYSKYAEHHMYSSIVLRIFL